MQTDDYCVVSSIRKPDTKLIPLMDSMIVRQSYLYVPSFVNLYVFFHKNTGRLRKLSKILPAILQEENG